MLLPGGVIFVVHKKFYMRKSILCLLLLSLSVVSCTNFSGKRIRGNGNVISKSHSVDGFSGVDVSGAIKVYLSQDSVFRVKVETDENLHEWIEVYAEGDMLHVHTKRNTNLKPSGSTRLYVSAPSFSRLEASGACDFFSETVLKSSGELNVDMSGACDAELELDAPKVRVDMSGASSVKLRGTTREFSAGGSGSTDIHAFDFLSETTSVGLTGAGSAEVFASVSLDVRVSGAASVKYKGNAQVSSKISGAGSVKKVD